jgi:hypothetical protein
MIDIFCTLDNFNKIKFIKFEWNINNNTIRCEMFKRPDKKNFKRIPLKSNCITLIDNSIKILAVRVLIQIYYLCNRMFYSCMTYLPLVDSFKTLFA